MKNRKMLFSVLAVVIAIAIIGIIFFVKGHKDKPIHRPEESQKSANQSSDDKSKLKDDLSKYRGDKPVSKTKVDKNKANQSSLYLNADNKVLVGTDSNSADEIKKSMLKWNSALGENVFLPAKENGRTDLLVQDDETKIPVNIFAVKSLDDEVPDKYKQRVVSTHDHRIMILDDAKKRYDEEFNYPLEDEINQKLGNAIGIEGDSQSIRNKLSSETGRKELKKEFGNVKKSTLHNEGLTSKDKETEKMNNPYNKTYATMTNYKDVLENLPRLKDNNKQLLSVIDSKPEVLHGDEAVQQGKKINETLQSTLKDIQRGDVNSSNGGKYYDDSEMHDGTKTIAGSNSKMGDDKEFINMSDSYNGGE